MGSFEKCCKCRKRYKIGPWLLWNISKNSQVSDRSASLLVTSDLE